MIIESFLKSVGKKMVRRAIAGRGESTHRERYTVNRSQVDRASDSSPAPSENLDVNKAKTYQVEMEIEQVVMEAGEAGRMGIEDPTHSIEKMRVAFEHASDFFNAEAKAATHEVERTEAELLALDRDLHMTEKKLVDKWNQKPRSITSLAEAQVAINDFAVHGIRSFSLKAFIVLLFFGEFLLSYFLFRKFVFVDDGPTDQLICGLIGMITVLVGFFVKELPDNTRDPFIYDRRKKIIAIAAGISSAAFILCVVSLREFIPTVVSSISDVSAQPEGSKTIWVVFNLSLLATLIFVSSFLGHVGVRFPRAYLKARNDEGHELLGWYSSDEFKYPSKMLAMREAQESRDVLQNRLAILRQKAERYSSRRLPNEQKRAVLEFLRGAQTPPFTQGKQRAAENAKRVLETLNGGRTLH